MKTEAHLKIVTHRDGRTELDTAGYIETGDTVSFGWSDNDYLMRVELRDNAATIIRSGETGYTMRLVPEHSTPLHIAELDTEVYTRKLLIKVCEHRTDFMADYYIGNTDNCTKIIIKVLY